MSSSAANTSANMGRGLLNVWTGGWSGRRFAALACVAAAIGAATPAEAAAPIGQHQGGAYGARGNILTGPLAANFGTIASMPFPCLGTGGEQQSNSVASASVGLGGGTLRVGAVLSTVRTTASANSTEDETTSRLEGVSVLGGLISADAIVAVSRTTATARTASSSDAGTSFVNLKIAGKQVDPSVLPSTPFNLPQLGVATLNRQKRSGNGKITSSLTVDMIVIDVTSANTYGLPIGSQIVIGHAASGWRRGAPDVALGGTAYATLASATVPSVLSAGSGATALQSLGCTGTKGETITNNVTNIGIDGVATVGVGETSAFGDAGVARTTAKLQRVALLAGMVSASEIRAVSQTSIIGGKRVRSAVGSGVVGLKVLGLPVPAAMVGPNTKIDLPGVGYLVINEQIIPDASSDDRMTVNGLRIVVTKANALGLPVGATIILGHATSIAQKAPVAGNGV